ncbi:uncharacterized protein BX664DRAFT_256580 [Halteromyces radiatus]|uniref:uncharacterized protein n=1 Tax=Halteromyces radiatus TaxID=101107 RepID=UPI00221FB5B6|nr:uncharacterized protein BX664DRAFT_256580 [Halteromyces radiatus]KAI8096533.1 hypothetical protein BX664DRAFT_256580 [Halteromyces radiatus]
MKNSDNGNDQPVSTKNDIDVSNTYAKDLDCPQEYAKQLQHILPRSLLPLGNDDLIRNLPPSLRAINLMCYFGGDGTGTPLHQDISGAIGHNIMLFGEESAYAQWLVTSKDDTNHLRQACRSAWKGREKCSFVESEQTCISLDVLAKRNVKTHVILQQPGDLVIIPSLCFHQVTNIGLSFKVAWNRITPHSLLNSFKIQLPLYRFIGRPELYRCKATIYFALKQIAVDIPKLSSTMQQQQSFLEKCRILLHLFANDVILPELIEPFPFDDDAEDAILQDKQLKARDIGFNRTCDFCCGDIFHRYYSCTDCQLDLCLSCYVSGRSCAHPNAFRMHEPYSHGIDNTDPFHLRNGSMMQYIQLYYDILDKLHMAFGSCSIIPEYSSL